MREGLSALIRERHSGKRQSAPLGSSGGVEG